MVTIRAIFAGAILLVGSSAAQAQAPSGYEKEPVLNAKDLAAPELLKGAHFTVEPKVPVRGFVARFTIPTRPSARSRHTGSACCPSG
jgi:hypothetical protein